MHLDQEIIITQLKLQINQLRSEKQENEAKIEKLNEELSKKEEKHASYDDDSLVTDYRFSDSRRNTKDSAISLLDLASLRNSGDDSII